MLLEYLIKYITGGIQMLALMGILLVLLGFLQLFWPMTMYYNKYDGMKKKDLVEVKPERFGSFNIGICSFLIISGATLIFFYYY